jgi:hypothetical protein
VRPLLHVIATIGLQIAGVDVLPAAPTPAPDLPALGLTNAAQILNLTAAQAAQALPVRLHGVVVDESDPREKALILADESGSLYI